MYYAKSVRVVAKLLKKFYLQSDNIRDKSRQMTSQVIYNKTYLLNFPWPMLTVPLGTVSKTSMSGMVGLQGITAFSNSLT